MFVALAIPEAAGFAPLLGQLRERGTRVVPPERLHVTLAFMAAVPDGLVARVERATQLAAGRETRFILSTTGGVGRFGDSVAWAEVAATPAIDGLRSRLTAELQAAGVQTEDREFRPHITIARAGRSRIRTSLLAGLQAPVVQWTISQVHLVESRLEGGRARWNTRATCALGGKSPPA